MASLTSLDLTDAVNAIARNVITAAMQAVNDAFDRAMPAATFATVPLPPGASGLVTDLRKKPSVAPRRKWGTFAPAVAKLWRDGKSTGEIAKALGVKTGRVTHEVWRQRRAGESLERRRGGAPTANGGARAGTRAAQIVELFRAGKTHGEIAAALGISAKHSSVTIAEQRRRGVPGIDRRPGGARKAVTP